LPPLLLLLLLLLWVNCVLLVASGDGMWLRCWRIAAGPVASWGIVSAAAAAAAVPAAWSGSTAAGAMLLLLVSMWSSCMMDGTQMRSLEVLLPFVQSASVEHA
jgi:hypothetical protein